MKVLFIAFFSIACALGHAWGQGAKPATLAELAKYTGADREKVLYEGAKKEGKFTWYTSLVPYKEIVKIFETKYPGVTVEGYRAVSTALGTKIAAEAQAKRYLVDTLETTPGSLMVMRDSQLLLPFTSPYLAKYPDSAKEKAPGGLVFWASDRESFMGVGYNKKILATGDIPKTFDDLLKPALKGKLSIVGGESGARAVAAIVKAKGEAFVRKLKGQDITLHGLSAIGLNGLIVTGEVPISFTSIHSNIHGAAATGAPVAWVPLELVVANAGSVAVSAHAPHPHAALLFADFLLSPAGQTMFADKFGHASPVKDYGFTRYYPEEDLSTAEYEKRLDYWLKLISEISQKR